MRAHDPEVREPLHQVDVAIVGAGPAGMVTACLLAREGFDTLVLEKSGNFDREFRGEILQPRFQQALRDVDLYDCVAALPHDDIDGAQIYFHGLRVGKADARWIDRRNPHIWWMPQPVLLAGLHAHAGQFPCYQLCFRARATELFADRTLVVRRDEETMRIQAKVIIGADGRYSAVRKLGNFELAYDHDDLDVVWFTLDRPHDYEHYFSFFLGMGNAFLILPKHPDQLQCGMVFRRGGYQRAKRAGIEHFKSRLRRGHPAFARFAETVTDFSPFVPLQGSRSLAKRWAKDGMLLIGDAAHTCSPAGGIGVAVAVETACVAAKVIADGLRRGDVSDEVLSRVQKIREREVRRVHAIQGQGRLLLAPLFQPLRFLIPPLVALFSALKIIPLVARRLLAQQSPMPVTFSDALTVADALELYFKRSGFGRETYSDRWVRLPVGPFTLPLPNPKPRQRVVPLHDVGHVIAEYGTSWSGELQITGYELGKGLGRYWFGWLIDLQGIWLGVLLYPRKTLRAFARGRRSGCLYTEFEYGERLLQMNVGQVRSRLRIVSKDEVRVTAADVVALLGRLMLSLIVHAPLLAGLAVVAHWLFS